MESRHSMRGTALPEERELDLRAETDRERRARTDGKRKRKKRPLTEEEKLVKRARSRANQRIGLAIHEIAYVCTLILLLVATRSINVVMIVGAGWGIGLAIHHFVTLSVPRLRQRWVQEEVDRERESGVVVEERRATQHKHVRSLEDLSAQVAHEIRNPISAAKSLVQQMGEDPVSSENIEYADVALKELDRVERSISHLLKYAREEEIEFETIDIGDVVASALATFRDRFQRLGVSVERDGESSGVLRGDAEKLRRVFINLLGNALDALEQGDVDEPQLRIQLGENLAGNMLWVRLRDNGPGVDPETLARIFSPFYTTKSNGTGLGLALSRKIVDAHGGSIEAFSEAGLGTEFVVELPSGISDSRSASREAR